MGIVLGKLKIVMMGKCNHLIVLLEKEKARNFILHQVLHLKCSLFYFDLFHLNVKDLCRQKSP